MKVLVWLITAILWPLSSAGQLTTSQSKLYKEAYHYIPNTPEFNAFRQKQPCVAVFDSIVYQHQLLFLTELGKRWNYRGDKAEKRLLDSLDTADRQAWRKPYYSPLTANLTAASGAEKDCVVILFSSLHDKMLLAEVSTNQEGGLALRNVLSTFNQTIVYLLFFGLDGRIQEYHTQKVSYN